MLVKICSYLQYFHTYQFEFSPFHFREKWLWNRNIASENFRTENCSWSAFDNLNSLLPMTTKNLSPKNWSWQILINLKMCPWHFLIHNYVIIFATIAYRSVQFWFYFHLQLWLLLKNYQNCQKACWFHNFKEKRSFVFTSKNRNSF